MDKGTDKVQKILADNQKGNLENFPDHLTTPLAELKDKRVVLKNALSDEEE